MKVSIQHLLTLPSAVIPSEVPLKDRILNSSAPLPASQDGDATIFHSHGGGGSFTGNGHHRSKSQNASNVSFSSNQQKRDVTIEVLDVHPSEPVLCFVSYSTDDPTSLAISTGDHHQPVSDTNSQNKTHRQMIVVQNYIHNKIVDQISLLSIVNTWVSDISGNNSVIDQKVRQTCLDLGKIVSVQFMDQQVLFYHTGRSVCIQQDSQPMPYMIVQFSQSILLYWHRTCVRKGNSSVVEINQVKLNNTIPTSKPIPILSINLLAIGCSDGAMRFYSICDKKIVKSVRGPNGKLDPVVGIVAVHPSVLNSNTVTSSSSSSSSSALGNMETIQIATICASGTAYIWELQVSFQASGKVDSFKIRSPLVKLELYRAMKQHLSFSSKTMDKFKVKFDSDRSLLYWTIQSGTNGKTHLLVWDWDQEAIEKTSRKKSSKNSNAAAKNPVETPLYRPSNIIELPVLEDGHHPLFTNVVAGIVHPSFSNFSVMILVVSDKGDMYIVGGQRKDGHKKDVPMEEGVVYYKFILSSLKKSANSKALGFLRSTDNGKLKISLATVSRSRPDFIILNTNMGLLVMNLMLDEETLVTGSHHISFPFGRGNGLVTVQDSHIYASIIVDDRNGSNQNGKIEHDNRRLVYDSPPPLHKTVEFQSRPVRMPPRILPSPSGNFLCLFWHQENRYEILHVESLIDSLRKSHKDTDESRLSPAVDSGFDVLSFAWVGDEDVFALLCPPELTKNVNNQIIKKKAVLEVVSSPLTGKRVENDEKTANDPEKFKPTVELKMLIGVNADAAVFNSSVAAATAKHLGSINLRGRHPPSFLFGGPVLCVRSVSQDEDTLQKDGMSHFYCLPLKATNNIASSYISIGPAFPYPDYVVWDDDGLLCAIIVERRIAIYKAQAPNFTLCGTAYLGTVHEIDANVQSAKFIFGVLYCTTEKSIQCIFLGDVESDAMICETDTFILATSYATTPPVSQHSIYPTVQQVSLMWPCILGYNQGSLVVSSTNGVHRISLGSPLYRIGILLSAGKIPQALKW
eukprot:CAMPEP_0176478852 /NCGR_PEP_ID=MMETSP0200_2-20121128/1411_1 /TAXON_ID=947934 /ORGANISM="Chaetoceros sp., Strain GSL56" /LENGTH=1023 /DNA_ID=CAMNT_0017874825 /DNA_START=103 /DNA_END=3171 /DNA_ORIENTATION=+